MIKTCTGCLQVEFSKKRRRHTHVVCNERREPHTSHYPSRPVTKNNHQQTTYTSHYRSRPVEAFFKAAIV